MKIIKLSAIDSTNTYLKNLSKSVALDDEVIVVTRNQAQGRGQMRATWQSKPDQSLTFSLFKRFNELPVHEQAQITFATSMGVKTALESLNIPAISIKWPNDIMSYQKKLCGILIENQTLGDKLSSSVIGVGINVNEIIFDNLPQATSMKLSTGFSFELQEVLMIVSEEILKQLKLIANNDINGLKKKYERFLFRKDKVTAFEDASGLKFNGILKGVSTSGELYLELEDESLQKYELKQIKMLF